MRGTDASVSICVSQDVLSDWRYTIHIAHMKIDVPSLSGYTISMKTAISLPDDVFKEAERFAHRSRKTRSQLYVEAITEYLARHAPDDITERMNQAWDKVGAAENEFITEAARQTLSKESW